MLAHTLGNPFDLDAVEAVRRAARPLACRGHVRRRRLDLTAEHVGTFGDLATVSFYPAHHITMGEGGRSRPTAAAEEARRIVPRLGPRLLVRPGKDNTCGKRFEWQLGELPLRLRPQVHYPTRLQPEGHRHAGGRRGRPAREARRLRGAPARNFAALRAALEPLAEFSSCPRRPPGASRAGSASRSPCGPRPDF